MMNSTSTFSASLVCGNSLLPPTQISLPSTSSSSIFFFSHLLAPQTSKNAPPSPSPSPPSAIDVQGARIPNTDPECCLPAALELETAFSSFFLFFFSLLLSSFLFFSRFVYACMRSAKRWRLTGFAGDDRHVELRVGVNGETRGGT